MGKTYVINQPDAALPEQIQQLAVKSNELWTDYIEAAGIGASDDTKTELHKKALSATVDYLQAAFVFNLSPERWYQHQDAIEQSRFNSTLRNGG
jgi:hypothetical protein